MRCLLPRMPGQRGRGGVVAILTINGERAETRDGATLLEAARAAGFDVPTLCFLEETGALTSCMLCVVKDLATGRLVPACATQAVDGMDIVTEDAEIAAARKEVLYLLLNEHVGDCEAPCSRLCPAGLNVPRMLRYIDAGDLDAAAALAWRDLVFPGTLGRVCTAPCERVCRRSQYDGPIAIRDTHRALSERPVPAEAPRAPSGKSVGIVGGGLAGLSAAALCARNGHACCVYERGPRMCARLYGLDESALPAAVLDREMDALRGAGVTFALGREIAADTAMESLLAQHDAVIVACALPVQRDARIFTAVEEPLHVRAVGSGKRAAMAVERWFLGLPEGGHKPFNSTLGNRLHAEDLEPFAVERLRKPERQSAAEPLAAEAARCLHCDCHKIHSCKLRQYAEAYGLGPQIHRTMMRGPIAPIMRHATVQFEPGKCVKCGICVAMTQTAGLEFGMTFTGRGLESRVCAAMRETLEAGLGPVAEACARACPTAALALRGMEETS